MASWKRNLVLAAGAVLLVACSAPVETDNTPYSWRDVQAASDRALVEGMYDVCSLIFDVDYLRGLLRTGGSVRPATFVQYPTWGGGGSPVGRKLADACKLAVLGYEGDPFA